MLKMVVHVQFYPILYNRVPNSRLSLQYQVFRYWIMGSVYQRIPWSEKVYCQLAKSIKFQMYLYICTYVCKNSSVLNVEYFCEPLFLWIPWTETYTFNCFPMSSSNIKYQNVFIWCTYARVKKFLLLCYLFQHFRYRWIPWIMQSFLQNRLQTFKTAHFVQHAYDVWYI